MPITTRELHKRLRKLESSRPRHIPELTKAEKGLKYARHVIFFAVAQYLGDPDPGEAPITAYGRALGYEHVEFLKDPTLTTNTPSLIANSLPNLA